MKLLPFENITYKTRLKEDEVIKRLETITDSGQGNEDVDRVKIVFTGVLSIFNKSDNSHQYYGEIKERTFRLQRIIGYTNSFLPVIIGHVDKDFDGTTISVKMRMQRSSIIFLCIFIGFLGFLGVGYAIQEYKKGMLRGENIFPFVAMVLFYLVVMVAFIYERNKSMKDLKQLFKGEIVED